jgi:RHS repeat-associated protein
MAAMRGRFSATTAKPDGTYQMELSQRPLNYQDAQGQWQRIDTSLVPDGRNGFVWRVKALDTDVQIGGPTGDDALAALTVGDRTIKVRAFGYAAGTLDKSVANRAVFGGLTDVAPVWAQPMEEGGFEFGATLDGPGRSPVAQFVLDAGKLQPVLDKDGVTILLQSPPDFIDGQLVPPTTVGLIGAPAVVDDAGGSGPIPTVSLADAATIDAPPDVLDKLALLRPNEVLLTYRIDPLWLADPVRTFPVTLDPQACLGAGQSGCDFNVASGTYDHYLTSGDPNTARSQSDTYLRVGYDNQADGVTYQMERALFYFPDADLPDGATIYNATFHVYVSARFGTVTGATVELAQERCTWNIAKTWTNMFGCNEPTVSDTAVVPSTATWNMDATKTVNAWYVKNNGKAWHANIGIWFRMQSDTGAQNGEMLIRRGSDATQSNRPSITIDYTIPANKIDFAPELGPYYSPSGIVPGQAMKLPILVTNTSGFTFNKCTSGTDADCYMAGYRWFNDDGTVDSGGVTDLPASIPSGNVAGNPSAPFVLTVSPPTVTGPSRTLRLDVVHRYIVSGGATHYGYPSDFAYQGKYRSRDTRFKSNDSARFTGTSVIEREEFTVDPLPVGSGDLRHVRLGDGSDLAINLASRDLLFSGSSLTVADVDPFTVSYTYSLKRTVPSSNFVLGSNQHWLTNLDERIYPNKSDTAFNYTYLSPSGQPISLGASGTVLNGQIQGQLERPQISIVDERKPNGNGTLVMTPIATGTYAGSFSPSTTQSLDPATNEQFNVDLNAYRNVRFHIRASGGAFGVKFGISNKSDPTKTGWLGYTVSTADYTSSADQHIFKNFNITSSYAFINVDLYADAVSKNMATDGDTLVVTGIATDPKAGSAGTAYLDGFRFLPNITQVFPWDTTLSWTNYGFRYHADASDKIGAVNSQVVSQSDWGNSPYCDYTDGCFTTQEFSKIGGTVTWYWKKVGGATIAASYKIKDVRTGNFYWITYFAGPSAPFGAQNPVQVATVAPSSWTLVARDVASDLRGILGLYENAPLSTAPNQSTYRAPAGDPLQIVGFRLTSPDGVEAKFDQMRMGPAGRLTQGSTGIDYILRQASGAQTNYNADGLPVTHSDQSGNVTTYVYTQSTATGGVGAYTLAIVNLPSNGTALGASTAVRRIDVSHCTSSCSPTTWTKFTEKLGTAASPVTGRSTTVYASVTNNANGPNIGDITAISPIRDADQLCPTLSRANSCEEVTYTGTIGATVPSAFYWPNASGSSSSRMVVGYAATPDSGDVDSTNAPTSIKDFVQDGLTGVKQLEVLSWDRNQGLYVRPMFRDLNDAASGNATTEDVTVEGQTVTEYVPQTCSASCTANGDLPISTDATLATLKRIRWMRNGIGHVDTTIHYRDTGAGQDDIATYERVTGNAAATLDSFRDPEGGSEIGWSQTPDQYVGSIVDSLGAIPDLYHSTTAYDAGHRPIVSTRMVPNRLSDYGGFVAKGTPGVVGAWRFNDSNSTMADATASHDGSYAGSPSLLQPGGLIRAEATNKSVAFNTSSSQYGSVSAAAMGAAQTGSFSVEAWFMTTRTSGANQSVVGTRNSPTYTFNETLCPNCGTSAGPALRVNVGSGATWLANVNFDFAWKANRWYHLVTIVDDSADTVSVYLDGVLYGIQPFATAGVAELRAGTSALYVGQYGGAGEYFDGSIDEVSVYSRALTDQEASAHYAAGIGAVVVTSATSYDTKNRPTEVAENAVSNGGFDLGVGTAVGSTDWVLGSNATYDATQGLTNLGALALTVGAGSDESSQQVQLVPGQAGRVQFAKKLAANSSLTFRLKYWDATADAWVFFQSSGTLDVTYTSAGSPTPWGTIAYDITVPVVVPGTTHRTDGRIAVIFANAGSGTGYVDDVAVLTAWSKTTYDSAGRPASMITMRPGSGTATTTTTYAADAAAGRPSLGPTSSILNYIDGTYSSATPDEDVPGPTVTYDVFGNVLTTTDADGVLTTNSYDATNRVDLLTAKVGPPTAQLTTTYTYDVLGNRKTTTSPMGRISTMTYDGDNGVLTTTGPDGVITRNVYDVYRRLTATIANYDDGITQNAAENPDHIKIDDVATTYTYDQYGRVLTTIVDNAYGTGGTALIKQKTVKAYDLFDTPKTVTTYADTTYAQGRTTTLHYEDLSTWKISPTKPSGTEAPISPAAGPLCTGSGSAHCNTVSKFDFNGRTYVTTDAYGIQSLTDADFAGRTVQAIAGYSEGTSPDADTNVVTQAAYDVLGHPSATTDPLGRRSETTYDALGRAIKVTARDSNGNAVSDVRTVYTKAGRVDHVSSPADPAATPAWTRTLYDAYGRATTTIANYDPAGTAGDLVESFESGVGAWQSAATSAFVPASGATPSTLGMSVTSAAGPVSGNDRLQIHTTGANQGAWLDLSGMTWKNGHTYVVRADVWGTGTLTPKLGVDGVGGNAQIGGAISLTASAGSAPVPLLSWQNTSGLDASASVHLALVLSSAGDAYVDNLLIYDNGTLAGGVSATQLDVPMSTTAFDPDGEVIATTLPPGDFASERPLVATSAFDEMGRSVMASANAKRQYAPLVWSTANLSNYWPLDQIAGTVSDVKGTANATVVGNPSQGVAGGVDESRTAFRFNGTSDRLTAAATIGTTAYSIEAWVRLSKAGQTNTGIAGRWNANTGAMLGLDTNGKFALFHNANVISSAVTPVAGRWYHLVATRSGTTGKIYVDGVVASGTASSNTGAGGSAFEIAARSNGGAFFAGDIDEVGLYSAALDAVDTTAITARLNAGRPAAAGDTATALTARTVYDVLGRTTDTIDPLQRTTHVVVDRAGRSIDVFQNYVDGIGFASNSDDDIHSRFAYDALGEMLAYCPAKATEGIGENCDPSSTSPGTAAYDSAWHYTFDALGRQTITVPPVNTTLTAAPKVETIYQDGGRVNKVCSYSGAGTCASPTQSVSYTYDDLGRLTGSTTTRSGFTTITTAKTYYADGAVNTTTSSDVATTMTFIYDALGRLDQVKRGSTVLTDYAYNADGTIANRTDRDSGNNLFGTTNFTYDWADREQTVDATSFLFLPAVVTNTYRADGLLGSRTLGNSPGDTETISYDAAKRPKTITIAAGTLSRAYDRAGNVKLDGRSLAGAGDAYTNDQMFSYDGNNRLIQATMQNGATSNYAYDRDGNRLSKDDAGSAFTYTYDRADQLMTQSIGGGATASFAYDALGAMTTEQVFSGSTRAFSYDAAGRLLTITPSGGTNAVNLAYDELGRTKTRAAGGVTQTYSYVGATQVTWKLDTGVSATSDTDLVDAANNRLASKHNTSTKVLVFDFLGSVAATEGSNGTSLTEAIRYDGFGKTIAGAVVSPSKFRGLQDLSANGDAIYRMGARDYSPHLGAFTGMDSFGGHAADPRSMNRFAYALANPATLVDPSGHSADGGIGNCLVSCPNDPVPTAGCASSACAATHNTSNTPKHNSSDDNKDAGGADVADIDDPTADNWDEDGDKPLNIEVVTDANYHEWMFKWLLQHGIDPLTGCRQGDFFCSLGAEIQRDRIALSVGVGLVPVVGDAYQNATIVTGFDPIAGMSFTDSERADMAALMVTTVGLGFHPKYADALADGIGDAGRLALMTKAGRLVDPGDLRPSEVNLANRIFPIRGGGDFVGTPDSWPGIDMIGSNFDVSLKELAGKDKNVIREIERNARTVSNRRRGPTELWLGLPGRTVEQAQNLANQHGFARTLNPAQFSAFVIMADDGWIVITPG